MLQGSGGACILGLTWENKVCHFCHEGYWWWWHTWIVCLQYLFNINFAASETMPPDRSCSGSNRPGLAQEIFHVFGFIARDGKKKFHVFVFVFVSSESFPILFCCVYGDVPPLSLQSLPTNIGSHTDEGIGRPTYMLLKRRNGFQSKTNLAWGMCFW